MNYKSMLKGALALSFGLIVGSAMAVNTTTSDIQKYGATFESTTSAVAPMNDYAYEVGTNVTKYAVTGGNPSGWFGAAEDESKIIAANGGQALQLNTDAGTLTNKLESSIADDINDNGIAAAGAYIETEAKFVASDTLDPGIVGGTDDTKFAIYAYADESKSPCTTNLVVYHAYQDYNNESLADNGYIGYTNEVFDIIIDTEVYTKLRVEMKKGNIAGAPVNLFSVKIGDAAVLTSDLAFEDDIWFLTVEDGETAANQELSSVTFKGTGEVDNLAVGIIQETTTYAIDWTASQNVIASNLTDSVELAAGDTNFTANVQLGFYPTVGSITNILVNGDEIDGVFFPLDSYTYTVGTADAIVTVLAGEAAVPPTVISVAKLSVSGGMVDGAAPSITATVTDSNGDPVDASAYTIDTSAIDMTTPGLYPVTITSTADPSVILTNYYAVMSLTWFNGTPTQKALIVPQNVTLSGMHYTHTSQDGAYLAIGASNGDGNGQGHLLYSVATLKSLYGICSNEWEVAHNTSGGGKGMAVNTASGIMLNGRSDNKSISGNQSSFVGYDIGDLANIGNTSNMVQETYTADWTGAGVVTVMDGIDFNHAGTKVFGNNSRTDGPWVYQLAIDKNAKTMTWEATYTTDFGRVRSVTAYYIDGKDYIFVGEGAGSGHGEIAVIDPSDGSITKICVAADDFTTAEFPAGRYFTNVKVSGIASGEMYLYGCTDKGEVVIWALGHDAVTGEWKTAPVGNITSAQTASFNGEASVPNCRAFNVSDDNTAGFLYAQPAKSNVDSQFAVVTDISLAQRKALASATLTPAGSYQDVELGEITATVLDENGDTVAASEYTITTNAIDIATLGEYTVTITPVEGSVYSNAVTAVYTISEEPAAPTVITIALVNGATYTDDNGTLTFAAPEGYVVNSIYTNGVNTGSTTTFTTNGLTGTINIVAAAKKVRPAVAHKWYENPGVVASTADGMHHSSGTYAAWHMNGDGDIVAATSWATTDGKMAAFNVDDLIAGNALPIVANQAADKNRSWGAAVSMALNVALVGGYAAGTPALAYPLDVAAGTVDVDTFVIENDEGIVFNDAEFSADGQYLYTDAYNPSSARNYVYKFRVLNGLKTSGVNLELVAKYNMGGRVRSIGLGRFQGGDIVYALMDDKSVKYVDTSAAEPTATALVLPESPIGYYGDIVISAENTETPHMVVIGGTADKVHTLAVYTLNATGTALADQTALLSLNQAGLTGIGLSGNGYYGNSAFVTENEETFIFSWGDSLYAIQYLEPQYTATYTGSENVIVTNTYDGSSYEWGEGEEVVSTEIACLSGTVLSFYPTEGNVITNVTIGGVEQTGFDPACYTITVISDTNIVVLAGVQSQPIGRIKPEWAADADTTKFWAWVDNNNVSDYASVDYTTEYLLNTAVGQDPAPAITITSITVGATATTIEVRGTVGRGLVDFADLNGVLNVAVGSSVTALTPKAIPAANLDTSVEGVATITIPNADGCFFRARVDFAAPSTSLTTISE